MNRSNESAISKCKEAPGSSDDCSIIIFDIETTGLYRDDVIIQISAFYSVDFIFNKYITPSKPISIGASEVTGLTAYKGSLYLRGIKVKTESAERSIRSFINFIRQFQRPVILLAHNGFRFDCPRLLKLVSVVGMLDEFSTVVHGFADSLPIFRQKLPQRVQEKGKKFSIQALAATFLKDVDTDSLHNAVEDVKILKLLLDALDIDEQTVLKNSRSILNIQEEKKKKNKINDNRFSLRKYESKMSKNILMKMARAGINEKMLLDTFKKEGHEGLQTLLEKDVNGKPQVTKNKKILKIFLNFF